MSIGPKGFVRNTQKKEVEVSGRIRICYKEGVTSTVGSIRIRYNINCHMSWQHKKLAGSLAGNPGSHLSWFPATTIKDHQ